MQKNFKTFFLLEANYLVDDMTRKWETIQEREESLYHTRGANAGRRDS